MNRRAALAFVLMGAAPAWGPAWAQDRPPTTPARDVDVTYRSGLGGRVMEQRSRFQVSGQRVRVDTPTPGVYAIMDLRARTLAMVSDAERAVLDMPPPPGGMVPGVSQSGRFVRRGLDQVAGLPCTEWETSDTTGQPTLACYTDDGVMLRARRGTQVLVAATRVTYAVQDPALFVVPARYAHTSPRDPR